MLFYDEMILRCRYPVSIRIEYAESHLITTYMVRLIDILPTTFRTGLITLFGRRDSSTFMLICFKYLLLNLIGSSAFLYRGIIFRSIGILGYWWGVQPKLSAPTRTIKQKCQ